MVSRASRGDYSCSRAAACRDRTGRRAQPVVFRGELAAATCAGVLSRLRDLSRLSTMDAQTMGPQLSGCPWRLHRGAALHDWPRAGVKIKPPGRVRSGGFVIGGGYLLSHFRSTIGVAGFNFSVRNGKRWSPRAIATLVSYRGGVSGGTGRCKVKKSVDILPQGGGGYLTGSARLALPVALCLSCRSGVCDGHTRCDVCHSDGGGRGGVSFFDTASLFGGLATRKGFG